ncbi:hypothetical protein KI387_041492, partial [Taxus chinensis]
WWLLDAPLASQAPLRDMVDHFQLTVGVWIRDYWEESNWGWTWKLLDREGVDDAQQAIIRTLNKNLIGLHISVGQREDEMFWSMTRDGRYTVKSG